MSCTAETGADGPDPGDTIERDKLAENLHDGALQDLVAISLKLAVLESTPAETPDELRDRLHELRELTESAITGIKHTVRVLSGLNPAPAADSSGETVGSALLPRLRALAAPSAHFSAPALARFLVGPTWFAAGRLH